jgi:hypothetical protein
MEASSLDPASTTLYRLGAGADLPLAEIVAILLMK